jgi:hypothetical protein
VLLLLLLLHCLPCPFCTLQEVDQPLWQSHWQPLLQQQLGLTGRFLPRGGHTIRTVGRREGVALLWRSDRFTLLAHKEEVFREMLPKDTMPGEGGLVVGAEVGCCSGLKCMPALCHLEHPTPATAAVLPRDSGHHVSCLCQQQGPLHAVLADRSVFACMYAGVLCKGRGHWWWNSSGSGKHHMVDGVVLHQCCC